MNSGLCRFKTVSNENGINLARIWEKQKMWYETDMVQICVIYNFCGNKRFTVQRVSGIAGIV